VPNERFDIKLLNVGIFASCTESQLKRLGAMVRRVEYADGEYICHEGDIPEAFHVVVEGHVLITAKGVGRETCGPGDFFGASSVIAHEPRFASAQAVGPAVIGVINADDFDDLLVDMPALTRALLHGMAKRLLVRLNNGTFSMTKPD
jgi:CRP-like cAMP-binding protein